MELCEEGDLEGFILKQGGKISENDARYVIRDVLRGLNFMSE